MLADKNKDSEGEFEELEKLMKELFYRSDCPNNQLLNAYLWELVSDNERKQIEAHLAECPHCPQDVAVLRATFDPKPEVSPSFKEKVEKVTEAIFDRPFLFPKLIQPTGSAIRSSSGTSGASALNSSYHIAELDWDLVLTGVVVSGESVLLQGQLFGEISNQWELIEIRLVKIIENEQNLAGLTGIEADGVFAFEEVQIGDYALVIQTPNGDIPIPDIKIEI